VPTVPAAELERWSAEVLQRSGLVSVDARMAAQFITLANLRGVDSHGVALLPAYVQRLQAGGINPRPNLRLVVDLPGLAVMDGDHGIGHVAAARAMEEAVARARRVGAAFVIVQHTEHFGAAAHYAMLAAQNGMVGIALANGDPTMAPWGGTTPLFGTNPIAIAVPGPEDDPVVLDMATSASSWGRIALAARRGEKIPRDWAFDRHGRPTDDPNEAIDGLMAPLGGHKGYGLALMVDVLAGVLSGSAFAGHVPFKFKEAGRPQNVGALFAALDIAAVMPLDTFRERMADLVRQVHASQRAPGTERILVPGERSAEVRKRREREGIPLSEDIASDLRRLGDEVGVPFPG